MDDTNFKPLYVQVAEYLIKKIEDNTWPVGSLVPSETQLIESFKVSRNTARQALGELVNRGYIYRVAGRGSFVANSKLDQRFNFLTGFSEDVKSIGMKPGHLNYEIKTIQANSLVAAKLQIAPRSDVLFLHRLLLANDLPYIVVRTHLPLRWLELHRIEINQETLGNGSLYELLEKKHGIEFGSAVTTIRAGIAMQDDAHCLGIRKGSPVLLSERTSCAIDGVPIEYTLGVGHPERHQWTTVLHRRKS